MLRIIQFLLIGVGLHGFLLFRKPAVALSITLSPKSLFQTNVTVITKGTCAMILNLVAKRYISIFAIAACGVAGAQGIPPEQWSAGERQFVDSARTLYQQQGLNYSNEQAAQAVFQMRQQKAPPLRGIPESEWTLQERNFVEATRTSQGGSLSDEQARMTVQAIRDQIARVMGSAGAMQILTQNPQPVSPAYGAAASPSPNVVGGQITEEQIAQALRSWPTKSSDLDILPRRDGFDVNGQPFLDLEGRMFSYAYDVTSGAVTYAVKTSRGLTIKALNPSNTSQSLVVATGALGANGWEIQTASGKQLAGDTLSILSNGFLVGRTASAFKYQSGVGIRSITIPKGYVLAPLQRGNVGATSYILLEKELATGGKDNLSQMMSSFSAIGSIVGINKKADYSLMNIETGKAYAFNIAGNGKLQTLMSQCRQRNWLISECQKNQTVESVYGEDGYKNNSHYYWLVNWVGTPNGPIALTLEDGLSNIYITDLNTGKKVVALNRSFGIADWGVTQRGDGVVAVKAKLAFEWKEVPDAVALLRSTAVQ